MNSAIPFAAPPRRVSAGEEGQVARAHRLALLAWFGQPFAGASDAVLIDLVLTAQDPAIRAAALAQLEARR